MAHIVHGPIACAGSLDNRDLPSGPQLYRIGMTTDLRAGRDHGARREAPVPRHPPGGGEHAPPAVFVYNTCVLALIGDDLDAVQGRQRTFRHPGGAGGSAPASMAPRTRQPHRRRCHGQARDRHPRARPAPAGAERAGIRVHDVNLIGEYNIAGEFWHVLPLLDELGLRVLCTLSGDAFSRGADHAPRRGEHDGLLQGHAQCRAQLQERFGTPWFEGSFYGITDTSQALRDFARLIGDADLAVRTEALIAREEAKIRAALEPWRERLAGKRVLLYTGGPSPGR